MADDISSPQVPPDFPPRGKPSGEGRFTWLANSAHERILNGFGQTQAAYAIAVYIALCRESSKNKNSPVITATISQVAGIARLGYRKTFESLHALAELRVITIAEGQRKPGDKIQPPNTYTLCSLSNRKPARLPNGKPSDFPRRTTLHAENPKDSAFSREEKKNYASTDGHALAVAAQSAGSGRGDQW